MTGGSKLNKKLQVFVSSTYLDLKSERQKAVEGILRSKHIPAGMELFHKFALKFLMNIRKIKCFSVCIDIH